MRYIVLQFCYSEMQKKEGKNKRRDRTTLCGAFQYFFLVNDKCVKVLVWIFFH